jgi:hypothetical protein
MAKLSLFEKRRRRVVHRCLQSVVCARAFRCIVRSISMRRSSMMKPARRWLAASTLEKDVIDKLVHINRVAKVVKGGRASVSRHSSSSATRRAASASVTARRAKCRKPSARRPSRQARLIRVPLREGRTLHHDVVAIWRRQGSAARRLRPVPASSPAARCAPCSKRWASRTLCQVDRLVEPVQHGSRDVRRAEELIISFKVNEWKK